MKASLVPWEELTPADDARWAALAAAVRPDAVNPFAEAGPVLAARRWLPEAPEDLALLVVRDGPDWAAAAAVHQGRHPAVGVPVLTAWRHDYSYLGGPLVAHNDAENAASALLGAVRRHGRRGLPPLVRWPWCPAPVAELLLSVGGGSVEQAWHRPALERRPAADYVARAGSARSHKQWRRQTRRLATTLGSDELAATERSSDPGAVEEFLRLEASGWKGREGTAMRSRPGHAEFLRELCTWARDRDRLRLFSLEHDGRTAAMSVSVTSPGGEALFALKVAYDEALAADSPGTVLELLSFPLYHDDPRWQRADSCSDPGSALGRLWPETVEVVDVLQGPAARPIAAALDRFRALRQRRTP